MLLKDNVSNNKAIANQKVRIERRHEVMDVERDGGRDIRSICIGRFSVAEASACD
jgi:hypothetical protein